ncbi:RNA-directed DNA polymerase [Pseudohalocynthiibacter aestuariivivens]|nr:retron St85 family RNA-directed DNA polymerase [Pseudohalocynthiibacter aestuariivivens]QIE45217.1 RNA-directed DNA polymerase [Pseudohalocynthiibacter aestuariivivens]
MPPRSYYIEPKQSDYLAIAKAFFPEELNDARDFVEQTGLPYLKTSAHVSSYLGVSPKLVRQILHKPSYHYRFFEIPKSDGSLRAITTPKTYLKVVQWWICDNILNQMPLHDCVHGFRSGRSYLTNAKAHFGQKHFLNVDIESFFPSIGADLVEATFLEMGYHSDGASVLRDLVTLGGAAPTGSPTSPMIGNLVLAKFDALLTEYVADRGFVYTRYADDITISSKHWIDDEVLGDISALVQKFGFRLNERKTKFMGPGDRQEVTGIVLNSSPNIPRNWCNSVRGYLHRVKLAPHKHVDEHAKVQGILGTLLAADPEAERKITKAAREAAHLVMLERLMQ